MPSPARGFLLVVLAGLCWGTSGITGDLAPQHVDADYMAKHPAGQRVASGTFIVGMLSARCVAITGTRPLSSAVEKRATSGRDNT